MKRPTSQAAAALLFAMVLAGCSVSTPRHGFTVRQTGDGRSGLTESLGAGSATGDAGGAAAGPATGAASGSGVATGSAGTSSATGTASGIAGTQNRATTGGQSGTSNVAAGPPPVGVTKDTVTISAVAGFSGNYGAILDTIYDRGFRTWVDWTNSHGGIYGRKINAIKVDNKDTVEGGVAACRQIQSNGSYLAVSIVGFGGADVSLADCLDKAGITTLALNLSGFSNNWRNVYSAGDAGKQTKTLASFILHVINDHGTVGIIHTNDPVNNTGHAALVAEMRRLGMTIGPDETVESGQSSFVGTMQKMQGGNATTVALIVNTNEITGLLRDAKAIGYNPNWTGNYWVTDENAASNRALFEGIRAVRNYSATNSQAFADYSAKADATNHGDVKNSTTMALYGIGLVAEQALRNAGVNPTKASLPAGIEQMVNYNNGVTMGLSFGKGVRVAEVAMWPIQCCNTDPSWKGIGDAKANF